MIPTEFLTEDCQYRLTLRSFKKDEKEPWGIFNIMTLRLSKKGTFDFEPIPSSRTDEWIKEHSFSFKNAKSILLNYERNGKIEVNNSG